jgi:hypothetical protein
MADRGLIQRQGLSGIVVFGTMESMETITISQKEYKALKAAKARLDALSNVKKPTGQVQHISFADLRGALRDVKEFKGKTSVEVQKMIPALWSKKYRKSHM